MIDDSDISAAKLARMVCVDRSTITRTYHGQTEPSTELVYQIAEKLGFEVCLTVRKVTR